MQDPKSAGEQRISASSVHLDPEANFDEWMSHIDVNAHHFTMYVCCSTGVCLLCRTSGHGHADTTQDIFILIGCLVTINMLVIITRFRSG